jgi:hypothetical protein
MLAGWLAGCPPSVTRGEILLGHVPTILFMASGSSYTCGEIGIGTNGHLSFVHGIRKKKNSQGKEMKRIRNLLLLIIFYFSLFLIKHFG